MTQPLKSMMMAAALLAGGLCVAGPAAQAQPAASTDKSTAKQVDTLGTIQTSIVKTIGADAKTVHITSNGSVLVVARVNSPMNDTTHEGRITRPR